MASTEIEQKLVELQEVGNRYNEVVMAMRYSVGEQWRVLSQERDKFGTRYQALCDWFGERNLNVRWDKMERRYKIMPDFLTSERTLKVEHIFPVRSISMSISEQDVEVARQWHKTFAWETNHLVWDLLGKAERTAQEDERMIHAAHASRFHWGEIGTPVNFTRGDWLISHVYAVLNMPQQALAYAKTCLAICQQHAIGDFDLAYGYEAMARAYAALGQQSECLRYLQLTREAGEQIRNVEPEDKEIFFGDFESGPWYGMK